MLDMQAAELLATSPSPAAARFAPARVLAPACARARLRVRVRACPPARAPARANHNQPSSLQVASLSKTAPTLRFEPASPNPPPRCSLGLAPLFDQSGADLTAI